MVALRSLSNGDLRAVRCKHGVGVTDPLVVLRTGRKLFETTGGPLRDERGCPMSTNKFKHVTVDAPLLAAYPMLSLVICSTGFFLALDRLKAHNSTPTTYNNLPACEGSPGRLHGATAPPSPQTGAVLLIREGQQLSRPPSRLSQSPPSHQHRGLPSSSRQVSAQQFISFALKMPP